MRNYIGCGTGFEDGDGYCWLLMRKDRSVDEGGDEDF